ncbi:hypothetical protein LZ30DRAFT_557152, partial [Colletotrichum cereale]
SGDIFVQSHYEGLGLVKVEKSSMKQWEHEAVFCHNDLPPRNIIFRTRQSHDGCSEYDLSAMIDWELSGFFPASCALSSQDNYLSGVNRLVPFYFLLKGQ